MEAQRVEETNLYQRRVWSAEVQILVQMQMEKTLTELKRVQKV